MANGTDFYAVLGVSSTSTADEIKKQYRRLAKQYHPDTNQNDPKAADRFKEISEAYNVLGDAEKRKQYDDMRRLGAFGGVGFGGGRSTARPGAGASRGPGQGGAGTFTDFDVGGIGGLGDLFSSMFGGRRGLVARAPRLPKRGSLSSRRLKCRSAWPPPAAKSRWNSRSTRSAPCVVATVRRRARRSSHAASAAVAA